MWPVTAIFKDGLIIERAAQTLEQITPSFERNVFTPSEGEIWPITDSGAEPPGKMLCEFLLFSAFLTPKHHCGNKTAFVEQS